MPKKAVRRSPRRRKPVTIRLGVSLILMIERSAGRNYRTIQGEIEKRLQASFGGTR